MGMEKEGGGRRERWRESGSRRWREMDRYGDRWREGAGGEREQGGESDGNGREGKKEDDKEEKYIFPFHQMRYLG